MQSAHLCVIYTSSTKNCALSGFKHDLCFFVKSKMATIVGDVRGLQQRHLPLKITHLVEKIKGFLLKAKQIQNNSSYYKLWGGVPLTSPLVPRWGWVNRHLPMYEVFCQHFKKIKSSKTTQFCPLFFFPHLPSRNGNFFHLPQQEKGKDPVMANNFFKKLHAALTSSIIQEGTMNGIYIRPIQTVFFVMKV